MLQMTNIFGPSIIFKSSYSGDEMMSFTKKDGDDEKEIKFGLRKIVEVDADDKPINVTGHMCDFKKLNETGKGINCTASAAVNETYSGEDFDGNSTSMTYERYDILF